MYVCVSVTVGFRLSAAFVWVQHGAGVCAGAVHCRRLHVHTALLHFSPQGPLRLAFDGQPRILILYGISLPAANGRLWVGCSHPWRPGVDVTPYGGLRAVVYNALLCS